MESKDKKYVILVGTIIFLIIIVLLVVVAWQTGYIQLGKIDNSNNQVIKQPNENKVEDNNVKDIYASYKNFKWSRDTKINFGENFKYEIINSKLNLTRNGKTSVITSIVGTPKYITKTINGGMLASIIVITEEGDVWNILNGDELLNSNANGDSFSKLSLSVKIKDMTTGMQNYSSYNDMFYLTEDGRLINEKGIEWKTIHVDHIDQFGSLELMINLSPDNSLSYYDRLEEKTTPIKIKDINGNLVKAKQLFIQSSAILSNLIDETGGQERMFVVTNDNKLLYFDGPTTNMVAKEYRDSMNITVASYEVKKIPDSYGGLTTNVVIKLSNNKEVTIVDIGGYDVATKTILD